jgi:hypothetical protein
MGGGASSDADLEENYYCVTEKDKSLQQILNVLNISKKQALRYYAVFVKIDSDNSNSVSLDEFHHHFQLKRSPFSDMAFGQITSAGSGDG